MNKIAGIIVTYNPDMDLLEKNFNSLYKQTDSVVIVDNGSINIDKIKAIYCHNTVIIENGENFGIAKALNIGIYYCKTHGYKYVITMDQDSISPPDLLKKLERHIKSEKVAIVGPTFLNRGITKKRNLGAKVEKVSWIITSASLTSVKAWEEVGGYDEELFIDCVDVDFCNRLIKAGYIILQDNEVCLSHKIGDSIEKRLLWKKITIKNHSSFRKYFIARNTIIIAKKSGKRRKIFKSYLQVLKQILLVIMYEDEKKRKIKSLIHGVMDSRKYKRYGV